MDTNETDPRWRAAIRALDRAQHRYLELLRSDDSEERSVDLAWLALWRAERQRDAVLHGG
jgi:hypothetical protein